MSIELMSQVWKCRFTKAEQSVMLAMADHAKDDGTDCYPSIERIAWKTDYSTRQVQRVIKDLSERGILMLVRKGGRGRAAEYRIDLGKADPKPDFCPKKHDTMSSYSPKDDIVSYQIDPKKDDIVSSNQPKDDMVSPYSDTKRVTFEAIKGDILGLKDDIAMSPQSLTINKPSEGNGIISFSDSDLWQKALAELLPSLSSGVAAKYLMGSRLEAAGAVDGVPLYRVIIEEHYAAGVGWLTTQAAVAIRRKVSSFLRKPVLIEIVAAQPEPESEPIP